MLEGIRIACKKCRSAEVFPRQRFRQLAQRKGYRCHRCGHHCGPEATGYFAALYVLVRASRCTQTYFMEYGISRFVDPGIPNLWRWLWTTLKWVHCNLSIDDVRLACRQCKSNWGFVDVGSEEYTREWQRAAHFGCPFCARREDGQAADDLFGGLLAYNQAYTRFFEVGFNAAPVDVRYR